MDHGPVPAYISYATHNSRRVTGAKPHAFRQTRAMDFLRLPSQAQSRIPHVDYRLLEVVSPLSPVKIEILWEHLSCNGDITNAPIGSTAAHYRSRQIMRHSNRDKALEHAIPLPFPSSKEANFVGLLSVYTSLSIFGIVRLTTFSPKSRFRQSSSH